jgi:hypothetical protein
VKTESQKPQHEQNNKNSPKHRASSTDLRLRGYSVRHNRVIAVPRGSKTAKNGMG